MADRENSLAVLIDYENLALGTGPRTRSGKQTAGPAPDLKRILERLVEKGRIASKRAYSDWSRFPEATSVLHELGIELTEIPSHTLSGKNSADIKLVVDAMELSYTKDNIDTFVVVSGDSDFTPLVSKLKENGKTVVGVGMRESTSDLLAANCDEFIYYEDIKADSQSAPVDLTGVAKRKQPAFALLFETIEALQRENVERIHSSLIKDTMRRKQPSFTESTYGYRSFTQLLEEAAKLGFITMHKDPRSGTWAVEGFAS